MATIMEGPIEHDHEYRFWHFNWHVLDKRAVDVPDALAVGFIPGLEDKKGHWPNLPRGFRAPRKVPGYLMLFKTANAEPPRRLSFADASLRNYIKSKQYRGLVWIRNISIGRCEDEETVSRLRFTVGFAVGYTPFLGRFLPGHGSYLAEARVSRPQEIEIVARLKFKVGKLGDVGASTFLGYRVPSAWIEVRFRIGNLGSYDICTRGSAIPSQALYVKGNRVDRYEMLDARKSAVDAFVSRGACRDALEGSRRLMSHGSASVDFREA